MFGFFRKKKENEINSVDKAMEYFKKKLFFHTTEYDKFDAFIKKCIETEKNMYENLNVSGFIVHITVRECYPFNMVEKEILIQHMGHHYGQYTVLSLTKDPFSNEWYGWVSEYKRNEVKFL